MFEFVNEQIGRIAASIDNIPVSGNERLAVGAAAVAMSLIALYAILRTLAFIVPAAVDFAWNHIEASLDQAESKYWGRLRRFGFTKPTLWALAWTLVGMAAVITVSEIALDKSATKAVLIQLIFVPLVAVLGCLVAFASLDAERREKFDYGRFFMAFLRPVIITFLVLNAHNLLKVGGKYAIAGVL